MARQAASSLGKLVSGLKSSKSHPTDAELQDMIAKKAYELFEKKGYSHGDDWQDWLEAERIIKRKYNLK